VVIEFSEPVLALIRRAHPQCNLDGLIGISFKFDRHGNVIDCTGVIDGTKPSEAFQGKGLVLLQDQAKRRFEAARQRRREKVAQFATVIPFPGSKTNA